MNHQRSLNEEFKLREKARKIQNVLQSGHVPFIIARRITLCCEQLLRVCIQYGDDNGVVQINTTVDLCIRVLL